MVERESNVDSESAQDVPEVPAETEEDLPELQEGSLGSDGSDVGRHDGGSALVAKDSDVEPDKPSKGGDVESDQRARDSDVESAGTSSKDGEEPAKRSNSSVSEHDKSKDVEPDERSKFSVSEPDKRSKDIDVEPDERSKFSASEPDKEFDQGNWYYMCVEAQGVGITRNPGEKAVKEAMRISFGEMVSICERGFVGGRNVVHLADGRGWVKVMNGKNRLMSECIREELDPPEIFSAVRKAVVYPSPCYDRSMKKANLLPGEIMLSREKATVFCKSKKGEERMVFYKVDARAGSAYTHKDGWSVQSVNGSSVIAPIQLQDVSEPEWYLVVNERGVGLRSRPTTFEKARLGSNLAYGELVCVVHKAYQDDYVYLKLKSGGWAFEMKGDTRAMVRVLPEQHPWTYVCSDKRGADIRNSPCRVDTQKTGHHIKHQQRIVVMEKARVGDEVFLHCAPPICGWVTESKKSGGRKMRALREVTDYGKPVLKPDMDASTTFSPEPSSYHDMGYASSYITPQSSRCESPSSYTPQKSHRDHSPRPSQPRKGSASSLRAQEPSTPPMSTRRCHDYSPVRIPRSLPLQAPTGASTDVSSSDVAKPRSLPAQLPTSTRVRQGASQSSGNMKEPRSSQDETLDAEVRNVKEPRAPAYRPSQMRRDEPLEDAANSFSSSFRRTLDSTFCCCGFRFDASNRQAWGESPQS